MADKRPRPITVMYLGTLTTFYQRPPCQRCECRPCCCPPRKKKAQPKPAR